MARTDRNLTELEKESLRCKHSFKRRDHRNELTVRHAPHLVVRWFHWSRRPRLYVHYWEHSMHEMRYVPASRRAW